MRIIRVHKETPYAKRGEPFCLYAFRGILSSANNQVLNLLLVCVILLPRGIVAQFPLHVKSKTYTLCLKAVEHLFDL